MHNKKAIRDCIAYGLYWLWHSDNPLRNATKHQNMTRLSMRPLHVSPSSRRHSYFKPQYLKCKLNCRNVYWNHHRIGQTIIPKYYICGGQLQWHTLYTYTHVGFIRTLDRSLGLVANHMAQQQHRNSQVPFATTHHQQLNAVRGKHDFFIQSFDCGVYSPWCLFAWRWCCALAKSRLNCLRCKYF